MPSVTTRIRVPFPDVDSSGRIHFTALFRYFEMTDHDLMRAIGFPYAALFVDQAYPRVHAECDYSGAILFADQLDVAGRVERVGRTSWTLAFTVRLAAHAERGVPDARPIGGVVATGKVTIVAMHPHDEVPIPIPDELRRALEGEVAPQ